MKSSLPYRRAFAVIVMLAWAAIGTFIVPDLAAAERADSGASDASVSDAATSGVADDYGRLDPASADLRRTAAQIRDLVAGHLAADIAPSSLFDVALGDEAAIALEAARISALLREVEREEPHARDAGRRHVDAGRAAAQRASGAEDASVAPAVPEPTPELWAARIDLDRARLAFYALPASKREALLTIDDKTKSDSGAPSEAQRRANEAEAERVKALQSARDARSEAERAVSEELARLLDVERKQAELERRLAEDREQIEKRRETTLGLQRRARQSRAPQATADTADDAYDVVRKALREARDDLDHALDAIAQSTTDVVGAGPNPIAELQTTVDLTAVREERKRVETAATRLTIEGGNLEKERASQLLDEIDALNTERLALLPFLSAPKRSSITGFTAVGADQAFAELRQLSLIARYHRYAAKSWLTDIRNGQTKIGLGLGGSLFVLLEWICALAAFVAVRRRTPAVLRTLQKRAQDSERQERLTSASPVTVAATFTLQIHRPIEWLLLSLALSWLLPAAAQDLLEVQLVTVIVEWILGGALVVVVVDAIAGSKHSGTDGKNDTPALRLRSLRLVGRVVVAFGLVLVLTSRLVGPGTIYQWVLSTCWVASLPMILVLIRWWRDEVFSRAEKARRKTTFEKWMLANREGWKSFLAATSGGIYLFTRGVYRAIRSWVSRFNITRSVLAYLFRRQLGKLEAERTELVTARIPDEAFDALGPDVASREHVHVDVDVDVTELESRLRDRRGGVVALIGGYGMGKSAILRHLHETFPDTLLVATPDEGAGALNIALREKVGIQSDTSWDAIAAAVESSPSGRAFLFDEAQRFIQPLMGGLAAFDDLLAAAGKHSKGTTWVLAIDEVVWLFLQRARGERPLFDTVIQLHPWREEEIIELLRARTADAGLTPSFERLLEKLPSNADEVDRQDALAERARSYYRLLWDYAGGNPGVALHMWRRSLGADPDGTTHVRFFQTPDTLDLELLPDQAVFVLRAVLQLSPATRDEIGHATMLQNADIADALRYAEAHGYVTERDGRYTVTWTWRRALSLFLRRRHLLVAP